MQTTTQQTKVYSLFNQSGKIEEVKPVPALPYGCKIYHYGYAMDGSISAVISGPDQFGTYKTVIISDYNAGFCRVDQYSRPHSKKFGIGSYFDDNLEVFSPEVIQAAIIKAEEADRQRAEQATAKAEADRKAIENYPSQYPYLKPIAEQVRHDYGQDWKAERKARQEAIKGNIFAMLKKEFPGVNFGLKKLSSGDGYNVSWLNGPTVDEVSKYASMFQDGRMDITGDFVDRETDNFQKVFGSVKYIFEDRDLSTDLQELREEFFRLYDDPQVNEWEKGNTFYQILRRTSYPVGAHSFSIEKRSDANFCSIQDFFKVTFLAPEKKEAAPLNVQGITLVDYSPKAVAVVGETKEIKEQLKQLGGRWNKFLSCGAGWIFPKTKETELKTVLGI